MPKELTAAKPDGRGRKRRGHERRGRELAVVFGLLLLTAVITTWPLVLQPTGALATGGTSPTVALFGLFSMEWTAQALEEDRAYWDAPFFHPHRGTFAWSETQPATALLVWILSWAVGSVLAYNLVLWLYLAAFGAAGYALGRQLTSDRTAALWASLWLTGGAFSLQQLGVLHLLAGAFPVACLALILCHAGNDAPRWTAWGAGAAYALTWLTCAQYGLFLTLLLPFPLLAVVVEKAKRWRRLVTVVLPLGAGLLLVSPWLLAQRARLEAMGFERSLINVRGAYQPADLFLPARGHWLTGRLLGWSDAAGAYPWDLGVVLLLSLAVAVALGGFRPRRLDPVVRRRGAALLSLATGALLLGFGPNLAIPTGGEPIVPYAWLHAVVPGLSGVRTPSRFGMFAIVGIVALAAAALAFLRRRMTGRNRRVLTAVAFALLAAEMWAVPISRVDPGDGVEDHRQVLDWLAENGGGRPLVDLPMSGDDSEAELEREARAMHRALHYGSPIVNGYSGYFPEPFRQLRWALAEDPGGRGRRYLAALGVRYALIHRHSEPRDGAGELDGLLGGEVVFDDGADAVLRLPDGAAVERLRPPSGTPAFPTRPRRDDILTLSIAPNTHQARFFAAPPGHRLRVNWTDELGMRRTTPVAVGGTVLVPAGSSALYVLLQRFPADGGVGRGALLSEERVRRSRRGAP